MTQITEITQMTYSDDEEVGDAENSEEVGSILPSLKTTTDHSTDHAEPGFSSEIRFLARFQPWVHQFLILKQLKKSTGNLLVKFEFVTEAWVFPNFCSDVGNAKISCMTSCPSSRYVGAGWQKMSTISRKCKQLRSTWILILRQRLWQYS